MRLDSNINTPSGSFGVTLTCYPQKDYDFACLVFGDATIHRVDYRLRQEWHRSTASHVWTLTHQDLTRKDANFSAAYPIKARDKARDEVHAVLVNFITPDKLHAAVCEERQERIQNTIDAIEQHRQEMEKNQALLSQLRMEEIADTIETARIAVRRMK
jgi:hypothetical protein